MTQVKLPVSSQDYTPDLPELKTCELNWMGRIVEWIHSSKSQGWFHHAVVSTIMIVVSSILIFSVVLSPLFIYGFRKFIIQQERARHDQQFEHLLEMAKGAGRAQFLRGRLDPLDKLSVPLRSSTRNQIIRDLELSSERAKTISDKDLLLSAAIKFDNYLERYHFDVRSRSQYRIWRMLGY